ncbi:hypothetical protein [uncultured Clostridium sp.]|uniref:hypothetical protein n=1 Tax=uncultured Clostridium sp. TaxID=59620 RepID=UPI0026086B76|nr:hypothetical protein [uncultured Clostridium sp.]
MRSKKKLTQIKGIQLELKRYLKFGAITKDDLLMKEDGLNPILTALEKGRALTK